MRMPRLAAPSRLGWGGPPAGGPGRHGLRRAAGADQQQIGAKLGHHIKFSFSRSKARPRRAPADPPGRGTAETSCMLQAEVRHHAGDVAGARGRTTDRSQRFRRRQNRPPRWPELASSVPLIDTVAMEVFTASSSIASLMCLPPVVSSQEIKLAPHISYCKIITLSIIEKL